MIRNLIYTEGREGKGIVAVRVMAGAIMISYGIEIFDTQKVTDYGKWLADINFPAPLLMAYLGKLAELAGGALLVLGLLTRLASILLVIPMAVITFIMGEGNLRSDSFLLLLLSLTFFFVGAGKWSLDHLLFGQKNNAPATR